MAFGMERKGSAHDPTPLFPPPFFRSGCSGTGMYLNMHTRTHTHNLAKLFYKDSQSSPALNLNLP